MFRNSYRHLLAALLLAVAAAGSGAQATPANPAPVVVRAARMLDVASGQMLRNATVVVTGDRITAVNPATPPAGASASGAGGRLSTSRQLYPACDSLA